MNGYEKTFGFAWITKVLNYRRNQSWLNQRNKRLLVGFACALLPLAVAKSPGSVVGSHTNFKRVAA